jgi:hypothetical protein
MFFGVTAVALIAFTLLMIVLGKVDVWGKRAFARPLELKSDKRSTNSIRSNAC